ncbi:hypothetical protein C6A85_000000115570 [Mycobacterium sp. ITM-2017-0098]|nr:hypothetical protein C6A85_000000115570 [Mycobacterium sp. ITM-2017-0098]
MSRLKTSVTGGIAISAVGSALPPAVLLVTQILLAQSLGVSGRGTTAAATAPLMLGIGLLTLGFPEAVTYFLAGSRAARTGRQFVLTLIALTTSGLLGIGLIAAFAKPLSGNNDELAALMVTASVALVPALLTAALRAVALGARSWWLITAERTLGALVQLAAICVLQVVDLLTPLTATLAITASTFAGAIVYLSAPGWWRGLHASSEARGTESFRGLSLYAGRVWVGSIAGVILLRLDQVFMTPLAGVVQLGIYVVAVNVSNVALLFNSAVGQVMFAVESGDPSEARVGRAVRITTLVTVFAAACLGVVAPFLIPVLFGAEFSPATPVLNVLLLGICLSIPGSVAGAVLVGRGHPGLRSVSMAISTFSYVLAMIMLIPRWGALGAAFAMFLATVVPGYLNIYFLHKRCGVELSEFYRFRKTDFAEFQRAPRRLIRKIRAARRRS